MVKITDEIDNRYGRLVVISRAAIGKNSKGALWVCICDCGAEVVELGKQLRRGSVKCCGCSHWKDEVGKIYGNLTVLSRVSLSHPSRKGYKWLCHCSCGKKKVIYGHLLRSGKSTSCGFCTRPIITNQIQGYSKHYLYGCWSKVLERCYSKNNPSYKDYGARGIKVYEEWHQPHPFYKWIEENLGQRPEGFSLDRVNVYGDYSPDNVRWASPVEQVNNRRLVLLSEEEYQLVMNLRENKR